jgi:hypothetical protein
MDYAEKIATERERATRDILRDSNGMNAQVVSTGGNCSAVVYEVSEDYQIVYTDMDPARWDDRSLRASRRRRVLRLGERRGADATDRGDAALGPPHVS